MAILILSRDNLPSMCSLRVDSLLSCHYLWGVLLFVRVASRHYCYVLPTFTPMEAPHKAFRFLHVIRMNACRWSWWAASKYSLKFRKLCILTCFHFFYSNWDDIIMYDVRYFWSVHPMPKFQVSHCVSHFNVRDLRMRFQIYSTLFGLAHCSCRSTR